ncbi:MAG: hypothetical protein PVJ01_05005 [Pseudomonadota bacterium]|jgi:hypothetical protein
MKRCYRFGCSLIIGSFLLVLWTAGAHASSVRLSYGFKPGAVYRVTELNHDVGKTITEMNMMGQLQKFENATDQVSEGTWTAQVTGREGKNVRLAVKYGHHKGGQRWSSNKIQSDDMFAGSSAEVLIHPHKGLVGSKVNPEGDSTVSLIYQARFAWLPVLPEGFIKKGSSFTHEYVLRSGIYNVRITDEYYLVQIKGNYVTFDVETRQLMVIRMDQGPGGAGAMQGMNLADMKLAYKGDGTAVFDINEGIFVEKTGKMSYSNLDSGDGETAGMSFNTRMEGVAKYSWEMERE